jgi:hypothetical protein
MIAFTFDIQVYDAIKHPPLKDHIDEVEKTLYGTNSNMFVILENGGCPQ